YLAIANLFYHYLIDPLDLFSPTRLMPLSFSHSFVALTLCLGRCPARSRGIHKEQNSSSHKQGGDPTKGYPGTDQH
ncbi:unnamed protein product, partial [Mycena citricolor]